jgi:hypothetical protein
MKKLLSLPASLAAKLAAEAVAHKVTESAIVEDALEAHFWGLDAAAWERIAARAERGRAARRVGGAKGRDARHGRTRSVLDEGGTKR